MNEDYEPPAAPDLDLVLGIPRWAFIGGILGAIGLSALLIAGVAVGSRGSASSSSRGRR